MKKLFDNAKFLIKLQRKSGCFEKVHSVTQFTFYFFIVYSEIKCGSHSSY